MLTRAGARFWAPSQARMNYTSSGSVGFLIGDACIISVEHDQPRVAKVQAWRPGYLARLLEIKSSQSVAFLRTLASCHVTPWFCAPPPRHGLPYRLRAWNSLLSLCEIVEQQVALALAICRSCNGCRVAQSGDVRIIVLHPATARITDSQKLSGHL